MAREETPECFNELIRPDRISIALHAIVSENAASDNCGEFNKKLNIRR
jgi:hypothetical protein